MWFHIKGAEGSHVVLHNCGELSEEEIRNIVASNNSSNSGNSGNSNNNNGNNNENDIKQQQQQNEVVVTRVFIISEYTFF